LAAAKLTKSQHLFEAFCVEQGISCTPIAPASTRTPDYRIRVAGNPVVAEIKQLNPNASDRAAARAMAHGRPGGFGGEAGSRIRHLIDKGKMQVANLARGRCPGLLVIFNNVEACPSYTDPMFVMVAMYGHLTLDYLLHSDPSIPPTTIRVRHGLKNKVSPSSNTSLSAVCILQERSDGRALLTFYHNKFAAIPFGPEWLRAPEVWHYGITSDTRATVSFWTPL
jgi:hypothetical protein